VELTASTYRFWSSLGWNWP